VDGDVSVPIESVPDSANSSDDVFEWLDFAAQATNVNIDCSIIGSVHIARRPQRINDVGAVDGNSFAKYEELEKFKLFVRQRRSLGIDDDLFARNIDRYPGFFLRLWRKQLGNRSRFAQGEPNDVEVLSSLVSGGVCDRRVAFRPWDSVVYCFTKCCKHVGEGCPSGFGSGFVEPDIQGKPAYLRGILACVCH
jgi:hypothetical protein